MLEIDKLLLALYIYLVVRQMWNFISILFNDSVGKDYLVNVCIFEWSDSSINDRTSRSSVWILRQYLYSIMQITNTFMWYSLNIHNKIWFPIKREIFQIFYQVYRSKALSWFTAAVSYKLASFLFFFIKKNHVLD